MSRSRVSRWIAAAVALIAVVGGAGALTSMSMTQAAWNDTVHASAKVSAGTWASTPNTCSAVDQNGAAVACAVAKVTVNGWGTSGNYIRGYQVFFTAPNAKSILFSVDLRTATPADANTPGFLWTNAGIAAGAPFQAANGWTCGALPLLTARTNDWQTVQPYFQVYENKSGQSVMCG